MTGLVVRFTGDQLVTIGDKIKIHLDGARRRITIDAPRELKILNGVGK